MMLAIAEFDIFFLSMYFKMLFGDLRCTRVEPIGCSSKNNAKFLSTYMQLHNLSNISHKALLKL